MLDREFEGFMNTHKAVGHLAEKHEEHRFAAVFMKDDKLFLGPNVEVPVGLKVKLWNGVIV